MYMRKFIFLMLCTMINLQAGYTILIEYENSRPLFNKLHSISNDIKIFFPMLSQGAPTWEEVLGIDGTAAPKTIKARAKELMDIFDPAKKIATSNKIAFDAVQMAQKIGLNEVPYKLYYYGEGVRVTEIPHVTINELLSEKQREQLSAFEKNSKNWWRYNVIQALIASAIWFGAIQHYIDDDNVKRFKERPRVKNIITKLSAMNQTKLQVGIVGLLTALVFYPFYHFKQLFDLGDASQEYPSITKDDAEIFQQKTFSHSRQYGNHVVRYYDISEPKGYMTICEKQKQFKPIYEASTKFLLSVAASCGLAISGFLWFKQIWPDAHNHL